MKELICIVCPRGCRMRADAAMHITGNACPRGEKYARTELTAPVRTLTSTIKIAGADLDRCPVKTDRPIPKHLLFEAMRQVNAIEAAAPLPAGSVVLSRLCGTEANVVTTKAVPKGGRHG